MIGPLTLGTRDRNEQGADRHYCRHRLHVVFPSIVWDFVAALHGFSGGGDAPSACIRWVGVTPLSGGLIFWFSCPTQSPHSGAPDHDLQVFGRNDETVTAATMDLLA